MSLDFRKLAEDDHGVDVDHTQTIVVLVLLVVIMAGAALFTISPKYRNRSRVETRAAAETGKGPEDSTFAKSDAWGEEDDFDHGVEDLQQVPLWRNNRVPVALRLLMPFGILFSFIATILGHTLEIVNVNAKLVASQLFDLTIPVNNITSFNLIKIIGLLAQDGAWLLAVAVVAASVIFPYVKLCALGACWFLPPRILSFRSRGHILHAIDYVGKWSLLEVFLIAFTVVTLGLKIDCPKIGSKDKFCYVQLDAHPTTVFFLFTIALLLSLLLCNFGTMYHNKLQEAEQIVALQAQAKSRPEPAPSRLFLAVFPDTGKWFLVAQTFFLAISFALLISAGATQSMKMSIYGLARTVIELGDSPADYTWSVFTFFGSSLAKDNGAMIFLTLLILLVVVVLPAAYLLSLALLGFRKLDFQRALKWRAINDIISAWYCVEVYVATLCLAILEVNYLVELLLADELALVEKLIDLVEPHHPPIHGGVLTIVFQMLSPSGVLFLLTVLTIECAQLFTRYSLDRFIALRAPLLDRQDGESKTSV